MVAWTILHGGDRGGEEWLDSGYIFKGDTVRFPGGFRYVAWNKESRITSKAFELSNWKNGVAIKRKGKVVGGVVWEKMRGSALFISPLLPPTPSLPAAISRKLDVREIWRGFFVCLFVF